LVLKIPLPGEHYYLVESRQPVGLDKVQPDSGILILKINPAAQEGSGIEKHRVEECLAAFKRFDFQKSYQIAKQVF